MEVAARKVLPANVRITETKRNAMSKDQFELLEWTGKRTGVAMAAVFSPVCVHQDAECGNHESQHKRWLVKAQRLVSS